MEEKNLGIEALTQPNLQFQEINKMWGHKEYKSLLRVCCVFFSRTNHVVSTHLSPVMALCGWKGKM